MKVVGYLKSVPAKNSNQQKIQLLQNFIEGVNKCGDTGILSNDMNVLESDVGLIQGWVYDKLSTPHLRLRKNIIDYQKINQKFSCTADANLFLYDNKQNPHGYLRYSFNGVFPTTGIYCDNDVDPKRWNSISKNTGIMLDDYKKKGRHILVMMQRQGGWSMAGHDVVDWTLNVIREIKKYSDRQIILRAHPGDRNSKHYLYDRNSKLRNIPDVKISHPNTPLEHDLTKAWAVVNHNSSAAVGPIIKGYNCFITDPKNSQCREVSNTDFSLIERPKQFDRLKWLERISMFHWSFAELSSGECWQHMRNYVRQ